MRLVGSHQLVQTERATPPNGTDRLSTWLRRIFELLLEIFQVIVRHWQSNDNEFGLRVHPLGPPVPPPPSWNEVAAVEAVAVVAWHAGIVGATPSCVWACKKCGCA